MTTTESTYDKQAANFMAETGLRIRFQYRGHHEWNGGKVPTALWRVTFERDSRRPWSFDFHDSIHDSYEWTNENEGRAIPKWGPMPYGIHAKRAKCVDGWRSADDAMRDAAYSDQPIAWANYRVRRVRPEPSPYSVLACLTKSDPGTHGDFCSEYGYDTDSIEGLDAWRSVVDEWHQLCRMFTEAERERLQEIN